MFDLAEVEPQFGRVKGASWFPLLYKKDVMVLGQGGIGSWVSLLLSRIGVNLHIFDMDTFEVHNMTGQVVLSKHVGRLKVEAVGLLVKEFSPTCDVNCYVEKYTEDSVCNDIMICGFDNMVARKTAFNRWKSYVAEHDEATKAKCFFQDGRLLAEHLQIFNIPGDKPDLIEKYEKEFLFEDSEVQEVACTFKQTSHCAAMIASHMVAFLTNWVSNVDRKSKGQTAGRVVPFFYEYLIPANLVTL